MRIRSFTLLALVTILPGALSTVARGGDAVDTLLRLAPADAGMTLVVEDLRGHAQRFFDSPLSGELGKLPAVRAWGESERGRGLRQAKRQIEKVVGEHVAKLRDEVLGDAFALVLHLAPGEPSDQARGLLLTHVRDHALLERVVKEFNSAQTRKGDVVRIASKEWRGAGYRARVYQDATRPTEFYATLADTFAWSNSEMLIRGVIERHTGTSAGLAQSERFASVREQLPQHPAVSLYLDGGFLRRSLQDPARSKKPAREEPGAALVERYLSALDYAGAAAEWRDGLVVRTHERLVPDRVDGWIKAWAASEARLNPDRLRIPSTAIAAGNLFVDFPALMHAVEGLVPDEARSKYTNLLEAMKGLLLGRDVRKELLPYLGPGVLGYVEAPQKGDTGAGVPFVLSVQIAGESSVGLALENGLRTLLALQALDEKHAGDGATVETTEIQGVKVTSLRPRPTFAFAVAGGRLVVGRSPESVARAFVGPPSSEFSAFRAAYFPDRESFACADLVALRNAAEAHHDALVKRLASRNHRSEEVEARDLDQVLAVIKLFRAAYVTSTTAPDASAVTRTIGLIARDHRDDDAP